MLGRDFEDEVRSRSVFELASNPIGYFGKMNSTLGSVVPLAMLYLELSLKIYHFHLPHGLFVRCDLTLNKAFSLIPLGSDIELC